MHSSHQSMFKKSGMRAFHQSTSGHDINEVEDDELGFESQSGIGITAIASNNVSVLVNSSSQHKIDNERFMS